MRIEVMLRAETAEEEVPYACRRCGQVIGLCSRNTLVIGEATFKQIVTFACAACGQRHRWAPVDLPREGR